MKAIRYILMAAVAVVTTSCNDWLDVTPTSQLDRSELFSTESGYAEALAGVYANMTKPALYGRELTWGTLDIIGGVYYPSITGEYNSMLNYQYKRSNSNYSQQAATTVDNIWSNMYKQIAYINSMLETIDGNKKNFSGDNYNIIKGEALGLRAFLHFELLRMFGPSYVAADPATTLAIPYVSELSTKVPPIISVKNAMAFIVEDLKKAKELLANDPIHLGSAPSSVLAPLPSMAPASSGNYSDYGISPYHNRRFTFNYYAATATLARAYLWMGDKENALICAKEVIADQETRFPWVKSSNITTIGTESYNQDPTFATEQVFALNVKKVNDYMQGYCYFGTSSSVLSSLAPWAYYSYGGIFEGSTDYRQLYQKTATSGTYYCSKYYQNSGVYNFFKERVPLIRISEMYYIAAECDPDLNQARLDLEAVRSHRGLSALPLSTSITRPELDNEILKEYRKEFIGEGQLWYYFKRKNIDLAGSGYMYGIYYFNNMNLYTFDRPVAEDGNR
jgi:hypothetical protein